MTLSLMEFLLAASLVGAAAAFLLEAGLRNLGAPTRLVWLGALALGPAILVARPLGSASGAAPAAPSAWLPVLQLPSLSSVGPASWHVGLDGIATLIWLASAVWVVTLLVRTHRLLTLERVGWEHMHLMGREVFVSAERGPAVAGVWDPWIVLPRWVLTLPERELRLILLHEEEHLRAKDTRLLGLALALVGVNAWNPLAWWHLSRLRAAMEMDCDQRVLRREPDRATYGGSLIAVAARGVGEPLGLAAFTEGSFNLRRRIVAMTRKATGLTALGGGVLLALGVAIGVQACGIESPLDARLGSERDPAVLAAPEDAPPPPAADLSKAPVPTPYTVAPDLVNREEVSAAMEKAYSPALRAAMAGTATIFIYINERGEVGNVQINESSGHPELDEAALTVGRAMRFTPAENRGVATPVWVALPVRFQTR